MTVEGNGRARAFDAETDLFPLIDWSKLDLGLLAARLPKERLGEDHHMIRLSAGDAGVELADGPAQIVVNAHFDGIYAVRSQFFSFISLIINKFLKSGILFPFWFP